MAPRPNVALRMPPPEMHSALNDGDAPCDCRRFASSRMTSAVSSGVFAASMQSSGNTGGLGEHRGADSRRNEAARPALDRSAGGRRELRLDPWQRVDDDVADCVEAART